MRILLVSVSLILCITAISPKPTRHHHREESNENLYSKEISEEDDFEYVPSKVSSDHHKNIKKVIDLEKPKNKKHSYDRPNSQKKIFKGPNQSDRDKLEKLFQALFKTKDIEVGDYDVTDYYDYDYLVNNNNENDHNKYYIDNMTLKHNSNKHKPHNHKIKQLKDYDYENEKKYDDYESEELESSSNEDDRLNSNELESNFVTQPKLKSKYSSFGEDDFKFPDLQNDVKQTRRSNADSSDTPTCQEYNDNLIKLWFRLAKYLKFSKYSIPDKSVIHNLALIIEAYLQHVTEEKNLDSKKETKENLNQVAKENPKEVDIITPMMTELKEILSKNKQDINLEKKLIKTVFKYIKPLLESRQRKPCNTLYVKNINLIRASYRVYLEKSTSCSDDSSSSDYNDGDDDGIDLLKSGVIEDISKETVSARNKKKSNAYGNELYNNEEMQVSKNLRPTRSKRFSKYVKLNNKQKFSQSNSLTSLVSKIMAKYGNIISPQEKPYNIDAHRVRKILNNFKKGKYSKKSLFSSILNDYLTYKKTALGQNYELKKNKNNQKHESVEFTNDDDVQNVQSGNQPGKSYFNICNQSVHNELLESVKQVVIKYLQDVECRKRTHRTSAKKKNSKKVENLVKVDDKTKKKTDTNEPLSSPGLKGDLKLINELVNLQNYNSSLKEVPLNKIAEFIKNLKKINEIVNSKSQNETKVQISKYPVNVGEQDPESNEELDDEDIPHNGNQSPEQIDHQSGNEKINGNFIKIQDLDIPSYLKKLKINNNEPIRNHIKLSNNMDLPKKIAEKFPQQMSVQNFSLLPVNDLALTPPFFNSFNKKNLKSTKKKNKLKQDTKLRNKKYRKEHALRLLFDNLHNFGTGGSNDLTNRFENDDSKMSEETFEEIEPSPSPTATVKRNEEFVELTYILKHPKLVVYRPQFLLKEKISYKDYIKLKDKIFNNKTSENSDIKIVKIRKIDPTTSKVLYETKEIENPQIELYSENSTTDVKNKKDDDNYSLESMSNDFYKNDESNKKNQKQNSVKKESNAENDGSVKVDADGKIMWNDYPIFTSDFEENQPNHETKPSTIPKFNNTNRRHGTNQSEQYKEDKKEINVNKGTMKIV